MSYTAIKFENISKQYRLGQIGTGTLSHDLNRFWHNIRGKEDPYLTIGEANNRSQKGESDYVWALRNINLEVKKGDVLGIIGKNGAGKSTLLKILSRITKPTTGTIKARGRIASLLEVGTGFHREMTGRENIYLNGAIMGMTRGEIKKKFDNIVDFAGVERYVDTPVKRYSSGMIVRLGFAVAAHLEPEVLVVDEVLAVGDAEFQRKAVGKMQDVSRNEGRTVLFVSHNMASLQHLCTRGVLLQNGMLTYRGSIEDTINKYLFDKKKLVNNIADRFLLKPKPSAYFTDIYFMNNKGDRINNAITGMELKIVTEFNSDIQRDLSVHIGIYNSFSDKILHLSSEFVGDFSSQSFAKGKYIFTISKLGLQEGNYFFNFSLQDGGQSLDWVGDSISLFVNTGNYYGMGRLPSLKNAKFLIDYKCELKKISGK